MSGARQWRSGVIAVAVSVLTASCGIVAGLSDYKIVDDCPPGSSCPVAPTTALDADVVGADDADIVLVSPLEITPSSIDFGKLGCNKIATSNLTLTNRSDVGVSWTASLPPDTSFTLVGAAADGRLTGKLAPHASTIVAVSAKPALPGAQRIELAIEATPGNAMTSVTLVATAEGVLIDANPAVVDFGEVRAQSGGGPIPALFKNDGTEAVTLQLASDDPANFSVSPSTLALPAGGIGVANVTFNGGPVAPTLVRSLLATAPSGTSLCRDLPKVELRGTRINTDVTTSPGTIGFGNVGCGPSPPSQTITITNYATSGDIMIQPTLSTGARFSVTGPSSVAKALNTSTPSIAKLTVTPTTPLLAPVGQANATITIQLTGLPVNGGTGGTQTNAIPILMFVTGPILSFTNGDTLDFGSVGQKNTHQKSLLLHNTGNVPVNVLYTVLNTSALNPFSLASGDIDGDTLIPNPVIDDDIDILFKAPTNNGNYDATVTMTTSVPLCSVPLVGKLKGRSR